MSNDTPLHGVRGGAPNPPVERVTTRLMARAEDLYRAEGSATYGRHGHAVHDELRAAFTALEGGADTRLTPSGLSAVTLAVMTACKAGDHILVTDSIYGPSRRLLFKTMQRFGVEAEAYDPRIGADIATLFRDNTTAVFLESPGSLTLEVQDVPAIVAAAQSRGVATLFDNTWSGGVVFKPLSHGVDYAVHAATKYPSGGSDVFMGAVVARTPEQAEMLAAATRELGFATSPDDAYLVLRGMRTLNVRMRAHDASARTLAHWLAQRPEVARLIHPAFASHPDHALWLRDFLDLDGGPPAAGETPGAGGLFSVVLRPTSQERVYAFLNALSVFGLGFSYGGFESLAIPCDAQLTRVATPEPLEGPLVRFAVGLEPVEALIADLEQALAHLAD